VGALYNQKKPQQCQARAPAVIIDDSTRLAVACWRLGQACPTPVEELRSLCVGRRPSRHPDTVTRREAGRDAKDAGNVRRDDDPSSEPTGR
jgi:hypothetical protein